jgi:His-Xaa-Ser system protein HxsD
MGSGFEIKGDELVLRINPKVYPIEKVYATAYIFLDKFYFILDGDKEKEVIVRIKPKEPKQDLEKFAHRFFEEMISITNYFNQFEKNKDIIKIVLQRALFSTIPTPLGKEQEEKIKKLEEEIKEQANL